VITVRRTFFSVFLFLLVSTLVLAFVVPILLPPGTNTQEGFYRSIPFKLILLFTLMLLIAYLWTLFSIRSLTIERATRVLRQQVGQVFEERFVIDNPSRLGILWLEVIDESPIPGKQGSRVLSNIGPRQERTYVTRTFLTRRGAFQLGPTILRSGDPFGLFSYVKEFPETNTMLVLPMVVDVTRFPGPAGFLPGGRALRQKSLEVTPYAAGVREYAPGDPLNRIHWRSTARRDRLMVKEFEQDPLADVWIFVDAHEDVHISQEDENTPGGENDPFWIWTHKSQVTLPPSTFEYAVSAAASIANYFIHQGRAVGLASAGRSFSVLAAERGERQISKILENLAFLNSEGRLPLLGLVEAQAPHLPRGSTVVVITPSYQESVEVAVNELLRRDIRPIMVFVDPASFGGRNNIIELYSRIQAAGIPSCRVSCGDSLQGALESCA
jgi:uncharacterized protein (DUF58 family)